MLTEPTRPFCLSRPGEPTDAAPGSEKKIRIMIERASRREPLFHPLDGLGHERVETPAQDTPWWQPPLSEDIVEVADSLEETPDEPGFDYVDTPAAEMVAQPA